MKMSQKHCHVLQILKCQNFVKKSEVFSYFELKKTRIFWENHYELPVTHNVYICSASVNGMESPNTSRKNVCLDICPDEFEWRLNASWSRRRSASVTINTIEKFRIYNIWLFHKCQILYRQYYTTSFKSLVSCDRELFRLFPSHILEHDRITWHFV